MGLGAIAAVGPKGIAALLALAVLLVAGAYFIFFGPVDIDVEIPRDPVPGDTIPPVEEDYTPPSSGRGSSGWGTSGMTIPDGVYRIVVNATRPFPESASSRDKYTGPRVLQVHNPSNKTANGLRMTFGPMNAGTGDKGTTYDPAENEASIFDPLKGFYSSQFRVESLRDGTGRVAIWLDAFNMIVQPGFVKSRDFEPLYPYDKGRQPEAIVSRSMLLVPSPDDVDDTRSKFAIARHMDAILSLPTGTNALSPQWGLPFQVMSTYYIEGPESYNMILQSSGNSGGSSYDKKVYVQPRGSSLWDPQLRALEQGNPGPPAPIWFIKLRDLDPV
jgi:hypothetical protein